MPVFHLRTSQRTVVSGTKQVLAGERTGEGMYSGITKHFFKAHPLLCNNLLLLFFLSLANQLPEKKLKTPQLTMRGGRKIPAAG